MNGDAGYIGTRDVLGPNLTVLFVGFNPGERSGLTGRHFAGRNNRFWSLLHDSGMVGRALEPDDDRLVLAEGYGITNLVARTTPQASDLRAHEYRDGAVELKRKVGATGPRIACYLGKGIYAALRGVPSAEIEFGRQPYSVFPGVVDFVAPSPSGRATIPYAQKLAVMRQLAGLAGEAEADLQKAWRSRFVHNTAGPSLALKRGDRLVVLSGRPGHEVADLLHGAALEVGAASDLRPATAEALAKLGEDDAVVVAPSHREWSDPRLREAMNLPTGPRWRCRGVFLPPMPADALHRISSMPFREHVAFHDRLMVTLRNAHHVHVTAPGGTDVRFLARPFISHAFAARSPGKFMLGIPGEVTSAIQEGSAAGRIVVDWAVHRGAIGEDLVLEVFGGRVMEIRRNEPARGNRAGPDPVLDGFLAELRDAAGTWPGALAVGEFGLGTNAAARFSGCIMEDETVMGSCHFGLGANVAFGGALDGPFHSDLVLREPTIRVDGTAIVRDGLFVDRNLA